MSTNDKEFDQFLKTKFEQKMFVFKPQYWTNAKQLIQAKRGVKNTVYSSAAAVIASVTVITLLVWNNNKTVLISKNTSESQISSSKSGNNSSTAYGTSFSSPKPISQKNILSTSVIINSNNHSTTKTSGKSKIKDPKNAGERSMSNQNLPRKSASENSNSKPNIFDVIETRRQNDIILLSGKFAERRTLNAQQKHQLSQAETKDIYLKHALQSRKNRLIMEVGLVSQNGLNIFSRAQYFQFISSKIALTAGLGYSRLNQQLAAETYRNIEYSFGQLIEETTIQTKRLDYLELPIGLAYGVNKNNIIQLGAQYNCVLQSANIVSVNGEKSNTNGYLNGINKNDIQLFVGYTGILNNNITFSAYYNHGLIDISKSTTSTNYNRGIRFAIGYKLF